MTSLEDNHNGELAEEQQILFSNFCYASPYKSKITFRKFELDQLEDDLNRRHPLNAKLSIIWLSKLSLSLAQLCPSLFYFLVLLSFK